MNRLLDIITEPDNTITNMLQPTVTPGDYIFYKTAEGATHPAVVMACSMLGRKRGRCVKIDGPNGRTVWVSVSNCQLQSEWAKENEA
jgi:hypothetical protein